MLYSFKLPQKNRLQSVTECEIFQRETFTVAQNSVELSLILLRPMTLTVIEVAVARTGKVSFTVTSMSTIASQVPIVADHFDKLAPIFRANRCVLIRAVVQGLGVGTTG